MLTASRILLKNTINSFSIDIAGRTLPAFAEIWGGVQFKELTLSAQGRLYTSVSDIFIHQYLTSLYVSI